MGVLRSVFRMRLVVRFFCERVHLGEVLKIGSWAILVSCACISVFAVNRRQIVRQIREAVMLFLIGDLSMGIFRGGYFTWWVQTLYAKNVFW